ncbi:alanine--tRNA ligase [Hippea maritima]|uniref:Alanine--tRNA ligase n=1 Tax=Hippea maritima (strain ATCC 700847 / DSM 10411 / MH2) TaxID=760142 RepID=F2LXW3_HIPMA|nr:alanine--tRNA ligase [Hippea maritima]AEA33228.1 alanyl-tRNA synthetase [Hippea maritima DSM 10411]
MKSSDLRKAFLEYFKENGHTIVKSAPLVPKNDPTLLFVNAGMVQFKNVFLGKEKRDYARATSCQKCVRAGGKHNDLENVGYTARHHTFFEMLGNFSFGDYFKKEAIHFGWDFVTRVLGIDKDKLWITIFKDDDEAFEIWNKQEGVPSSRIVRMDEHDNFWAMGDTGPCGPCSEIHIDQGPDVGCGKPNCSVACDCDRYLELWNLVFMQYNRDEDGNMTPLPKPSIDTGMGLERVSAILQGVHSNFDIDIFRHIIGNISEFFRIDYGKDSNRDVGVRVIADHLRAMDFLIADGVFPDKEGRGYVLRRIMRRAMRFGKKLGANEPFLYRFIDTVNDVMGDVYPELLQNKEMVVNVVKAEEEQFFETLDSGLRILNDIFDKATKRVVDAESAFKLYDTYGFPIDLTVDIAKENGFEVDVKDFNELLEKQREASRKSWKGSGDEFVWDAFGDIYKQKGKTEFVGYDEFETKARLLGIVGKDKKIKEQAQRGVYYFIFDKTPFYAESGGQVADTGFILKGNARAFVSDVKKYFDGNLFVHKVDVLEGEFELNDECDLRINVARRKNIARHHTATHLLDAALIKILGKHVRQAGSLVEDNRLRFDFTHFSKLTDEQIEEIEELINSWIVENYPVKTETMSLDDAINSGAIALFDEKYSDEVRVVSVGNISKELCGGTHVKASGEIGLFKVIHESAVAKGIRRIEAKVGVEAYEYVKQIEKVLKDAASKLGIPITELPLKIEELKKKKTLKSQPKFDPSKVVKVNGIDVYVDVFENEDVSELRHLGDTVKSKLKSCIVVLFDKKDDRVNVIVMVTKDLANRIKAKDVVGKISRALGGKGGGKEEFAQGGGRDLDRLEEIIRSINSFL